MAYSTKVGSFNIDTSKTAGQTQAVTGVGFTPKIVIFWWSGTTATTDGARGEDVNMGFGAMTGASSRFSVGGAIDDGAATTATASHGRNDGCIYSYLNGTTTVDGAADFSSFDVDGFTLVIDNQFSTAIRVSYLALGGTDLTNVYIGSKQQPNATGNYSVTAVGFQPDALITAFPNFSSANTENTQFPLGYGFATGSSNQGVVSGFSQTGQATSQAIGYGYNGEVNAGFSSVSATGRRDAFISLDADGFTLNELEAGNRFFHFICLKGGQYKVGELTTRTDGNDIVETEPGFQPVALLFLSANRALSTQDTVTDHMQLSIGAATSASNRAAQAVRDEDNLADSESATANYDTAVYANVVDDAIVGLMDIKSIDATGFTAVMDDADPSENWVTYLAIGSTATAGSAYTLTASAGTYTYTGTAASLKHGWKMTAEPGAFSQTGTAANLNKGYSLTATAGTYSFTGTDANFKRTYVLSAGAGAYTYTGSNASLLHGWKIAAGLGTYTYTGTAANLNKGYSLTADPGAYVMTGTAASLLHGWLISAGLGTYTYTGTAATLNKGFSLSAEPGAYTVTGTAASLLHGWLVSAGLGTYTYTGTAATLTYTPTGATYQQEGYRWRNDDGSESAATWKAAQDATSTAQANNNIRLRFLINTTGDTPASAYQVEYRAVGAEDWSVIQ